MAAPVTAVVSAFRRTYNIVVARFTVALAVIGTAIAAAQEPQQPRFSDRVDVARIVIDVRVLDDTGQPLLGLGADDFAVTIKSRSAKVESAIWVGRDRRAADTPLAATDLFGADVVPRGRLLVFLFQKDLEPTRIIGLMRMLVRAQQFLDTLTPDDHVAILSLDSHLKIWLDFTSDHAQLRRVLEHGILFERPAPIEPASDLSLTRALSQEEAKRTYGIEGGLRLIAEALEPLPGSKSLVLFGHGFGRYVGGGVRMEPDFGPAVDALRFARVSVFSLDVTKADYHSLEVGLQLVSKATGGFYERTHVFPDRAINRLAGALAGHYVLLVEPPPDADEPADLAIKLIGRKGSVLTRAAAQGW